MDDRLVILPQPVAPAAGSKTPTGKGVENRAPSQSFEKVLASQLQETGKVKFSRHAENRMAERGITLNGEELARLSQAVQLADRKGARDSLVLLNNTALVVSIKNNTVVTVVDKDSLNGNVFTNIDSAIVA
jgi:flagellar operon protein